MLLRRLAAGVLLLIALPATATATTTLERTIKIDRGGGFHALERGPGEPHLVREAGLASAQRGRSRNRRSLAYFAQLTDPQIADEMSPSRVEVFDPAGGLVSAAWRPQEALDTQTFDQVVRSVNANQNSPVRAGGGRGRARLGFSILTGDQPDNMQLNETQWYMNVLNGRPVSPFSGQPLSDSNTCSSASPEEAAQLDAAVAQRRYTGVQDYDDYPGAPPDRYPGFWDTDQAATGGPHARFPRYRGLMERAQEEFRPRGIEVPWYVSRGNHDGLIQGNVPASNALFVGLATSCTKILPGPNFDPATLRGATADEIAAKFRDPAFLGSLFADARLVPPDPDRRFISKVEYKAMHAGADNAHGFDFVEPAVNDVTAGTAAYYAFDPAPGMRFVALDTVAEGGGASGNLDDPQYRWLERQLDESSAIEYGPDGELRRDSDPNRLIVVYGHHTLASMDNTTTDEEAGACESPALPGCDADPQDSSPIHLGTGGTEDLRSLLLRFPNVIALVTGHTHHNAVKVYKESGPKRGFWQINTASHVDHPQQSRLIEVMDNRDGTLSIFGTVVDQAAPIQPPAAGAASGFSNGELASLSRVLAANDPHTNDVTEGGGRGARRDRNVELMISDPRRLAGD